MNIANQSKTVFQLLFWNFFKRLIINKIEKVERIAIFQLLITDWYLIFYETALKDCS